MRPEQKVANSKKYGVRWNAMRCDTEAQPSTVRYSTCYSYRITRLVLCMYCTTYLGLGNYIVHSSREGGKLGKGVITRQDRIRETEIDSLFAEVPTTFVFFYPLPWLLDA